MDGAITSPHKLMRRARVFTLAASGARVAIVADSGVLFTFGVPSSINKANNNKTENIRTHLKKDGASAGTKMRGRLRIRARARIRDRVKRRIRFGKRQAASN